MIFGRTTVFSDTGPDSHHAEMEAHRAHVTKALGGHLHYVGSTTHVVEMFNEDGSQGPSQTIMVTKWQLAPAESAAPAAE